MYSKKYCLEKIEEFNRHNPLYDNMEGSTCYLVYLNVGERGWFLYEDYDPDEYPWHSLPHRVHTSVIKSVKYANEMAVITTQNTRFTFRLIK